MPLPTPDQWERVSPLLDELLDLPEAAREPWLTALRTANPALADELAPFMSHTDGMKASRFLSGEPDVVSGHLFNQATLEGQHLGPYVLEALIGQGGGGSVWRARRDDGRYEGAVAIKLLHLAMVGAAGVARFKREGQILARLTHAHIAHLLDAGVTSSGQPYLVLELVEGVRIDEHCDAHQLPVHARLRLFDDVLAAVAFAHTHGVIHRDLKPGNVLVDGQGQVKLLDFGIAKWLDDEAGMGEATEFTQAGWRAMTPHYAAPEQLRGEGVTTATDVYALGVMLYQLLAGQHPTAAPGATADQAMRATLDVQAPRLSRTLFDARAVTCDTTPQRLRQALEGDLETIVAHALNKPPAERYATVAAFSEDLRRLREHEPILARAPSLRYRAGKFLRRHRGAVAASGLTALAILAGVVGTLWQAGQAQANAVLAQQHAQRAETARAQALAQLRYAESANELMSFLLNERGTQPFTAATLLERAQVLVQQQFAQEPALRSQFQRLLSDQHDLAEDNGKAVALIELSRASAQAAGEPALVASAQCFRAYLRSETGEVALAKAEFDQSLATLRSSNATSGAAAECLSQRSTWRRALGDASGALADAQEAEAALGEPRPGQRMLAINIRLAAADARSALGQPARAVREYEALLAELRQIGRDHSALYVTAVNNLGVRLDAAGQIRQSGERFAQALALVGEMGDHAPTLPSLDTNLASSLMLRGQFAKAAPLYESALAQARRAGNQLQAATLALTAAPTRCALKEFVACRALLDEAQRGFAATLPAHHAMWGALQAGEFTYARTREQWGEAREAALRAVAIQGAANTKRPGRVVHLAQLARVEAKLGQWPAAMDHAQEAVAMAAALMTDFPHSYWLGMALLTQGALMLEQGDKGAAQGALTVAQEHLQATLFPEAPPIQEVRALLLQTRL